MTRHTDLWDRTQSPETSPHPDGQLIINEAPRRVPEKVTVFGEWRWTVGHPHNYPASEPDLTAHTLTQSGPQT